jgi:hypothetical protein
MIFKVLAFVFLIPGFGLALAAGWVVDRFRLEESQTCDFEEEMDAEELKRYKHNKVVINTKMMGMLIALPGIILMILAFR